MTQKKTYIIILIVLVVFFVVMFSVLGIQNIKKGKQGAVLLVGDKTIWVYYDRKWSSIVSNTRIEKLNWLDYQVYLNNESKGKYSLWHDDKWYAFDSKKNAVDLSGSFLAYRANYDMKVSSFQEKEIEDEAVISKVLTENGLGVVSDFTAHYVVPFDFDKDGVTENFYVISNAFPMDFNPSNIFSIVFMEKSGNIYPIYTDISPNHSFNGCKPFFTTFLDTDDDNTFEFVLSCGRYSVEEQVNMLYKYVDNKFKIVVSN